MSEPTKENAPQRTARSTALIRPDDSAQPDKLQVHFATIHTATVAGDPARYVIDADSVRTLDALEAAGHQIVDENGNWTGILAEPGRVTHHQCKSHDEVWDIVASLNCNRRQEGGDQ